MQTLIRLGLFVGGLIIAKLFLDDPAEKVLTPPAVIKEKKTIIIHKPAGQGRKKQGVDNEQSSIDGDGLGGPGRGDRLPGASDAPNRFRDPVTETPAPAPDPPDESGEAG